MKSLRVRMQKKVGVRLQKLDDPIRETIQKVSIKWVEFFILGTMVSNEFVSGFNCFVDH